MIIVHVLGLILLDLKSFQMIGRCGRRVCQVLQAQRQLHSSALARADVEFNILSGYLPTKVTRYGRRGFSINNNNYLGSLAVFTNLTLHWKVGRGHLACSPFVSLSPSFSCGLGVSG